MVLQGIRKTNYFPSIANLSFVVFLSHIICIEGVEVNPRKTEAFKN